MSKIEIDLADLPEVNTSDHGGGFVTALAQEDYQPQLRRDSTDGDDGSWSRKIAYANLAIALAIEDRAKQAAVVQAANRLRRRRNELAMQVAARSDWTRPESATYADLQSDAQTAINMIIELQDSIIPTF